MMDAMEHFYHFLSRFSVHHFLAIGIAIVVIWLVISGFKKGLKKERREEEQGRSEEEDQEDGK